MLRAPAAMYNVRARRPADVLPLQSASTSLYEKSENKSLGWWAIIRRWLPIVALASLISVVILLSWIVTPVVHAWWSHQTPDFPSEMSFELSNGGRELFASLLEEPSVSLSVVVPAYNEETRLQLMLDDMLNALDSMTREAQQKWSVLSRVPIINWWDGAACQYYPAFACRASFL